MVGSRKLRRRHLSKNGFGDKCRKLFYSTLLAVPLLTSCISKAEAIPRNGPLLNVGKSTQRPRAKRHFASCRMNGRALEYTLTDGTLKLFNNLLTKGEKVISIRCNDSFASVLTNTSLITVPGKSRRSAMLSLQNVRGDMEPFHKKGIVDMELGDDRHFILTRDRELREALIVNHSNTDIVHTLPYKVNGAKMKFHRGFLFIAPVGRKMLVMRFDKNRGYSELSIPANMDGSGFFLKGKRLFFGKQGKEVEIMIRGKQLSQVKIKK
jgi:hypothetical protein